MMVNMKRLIFCISLLMATNVFGAEQKGILGVWQTEGGESRVEIFMCGEKFCGRIIWLQNPIHMGNEVISAPIIDRKNPDPALRNRPVLGLIILNGFIAEGENTWGSGTCYDPKSGKTYRGKIYLIAPNKLVLRGYIGIPLFGRSSVWTR
jgi:uncharacterized protein (DUF2147 family)